MSSSLIIGVDIGTTGCRAVIYSQEGVAVAGKAVEYPLYTPYSGWAEQDSEEIYQAVVSVIRDAVEQVKQDKDRIAGMCFSSVLHSTIPVDEQGFALYRMLTWADTRSQCYTEKLQAENDTTLIYNKTGCPMHPMYPLSKILWFKYEQPDIFSRTAKFISIKEYIFYRFFGKYIVDKSLASGTGIYNLNTLEWDPDILKILGIGREKLADVCATTHVEHCIQPAVAEALGLNSDTAVVLGAGDGILSNVGAGAVNPGQFTAMIGTSGAVRVVTDKPCVDEKGRTWCYNLTNEYWVLGGAINNGGIAFRWARDKFASTEQRVAEKLGLDPYELLSNYANQKPPGSDGLIMLPYFTGERAPYWNANARGILFGLNLNHGKRHLVRATLEGVIYCMYSIFTALEDVAGKADEIRVSGSFTRSKLWVQIMADVFGRVISVPGEPEGSAFGAAILGMYALGILKDIKEVGSYINIKERYYPNEENHKRYQQLFSIYKRIFFNLQKEFDEIAEIQRTWSK